MNGGEEIGSLLEIVLLDGSAGWGNKRGGEYSAWRGVDALNECMMWLFFHGEKNFDEHAGCCYQRCRN